MKALNYLWYFSYCGDSIEDYEHGGDYFFGVALVIDLFEELI